MSAVTVPVPLPRRLAKNVVRSPRWRHGIGLALVLARKNVKTKYKRTSLGMVWAVGQPLLQAAVLTFIFTRVFKSHPIPSYGLFVLSGVMPYSAISMSIQMATTSVVDNSPLVKKVALPRIVFPISAIGTTMTVFGIALGVLVGFAGISGKLGMYTLTLLPLGLLALLVLTAAVGIFGAGLYVQYRDVKFMFESALLMLMYASPVLYTSDRLGSVAHWQRLNPVTGVLTLMRGALVGFTVDWVAVWWTFAFGGALLVLAIVLFERRSQTFADLT